MEEQIKELEKRVQFVRTQLEELKKQLHEITEGEELGFTA